MEFAKAYDSGSQYLANIIWANSTPAALPSAAHDQLPMTQLWPG